MPLKHLSKDWLIHPRLPHPWDGLTHAGRCWKMGIKAGSPRILALHPRILALHPQILALHPRTLDLPEPCSTSPAALCAVTAEGRFPLAPCSIFGRRARCHSPASAGASDVPRDGGYPATSSPPASSSSPHPAALPAPGPG